MPDTDATTQNAAAAWAMMARSDDPMPVAAAVDWLRTQMDTDDLAAVRLALLVAAADALDVLRPVPPEYTAAVCPALRGGDWRYAAARSSNKAHIGPGWERFWAALALAVPLFPQIDQAVGIPPPDPEDDCDDQ